MSPYDILEEDDSTSATRVTISLTQFGKEVLEYLNQLLNQDGIKVLSFCCVGENGDCLEPPVTINFIRTIKKATWKNKASNKREKIESDPTFTSIGDWIKIGAHCSFDAPK